MIIGKDSEGIPIIFGSPGDVMLDKYAYIRATKIAKDISFECLEAFIQGMDDYVKELNPISRWMYNLFERITPDIQTMAIRQVYEQRKKLNSLETKSF
ncbi:hypothetical protein M0R19_01335 [Candidatus Pacearchaeota archaeon]|jgi:hypothetical protein|nr:hypothetical protein [Candidatus Pacearchaeota archaeon]